jgi:hypothetical protein
MSLEPNPFGKITEFANHYDLDNPPWMEKWAVSDASWESTLVRVH